MTFADDWRGPSRRRSCRSRPAGPRPGPGPARRTRCRRRSAATRSAGCWARGGSARSTSATTPSSSARSPSRSRSGRCPSRRSRLFLQEARRLARLKHPGIVTVHDVGVQDGRCFIVSDFVAGDLAPRLAPRPTGRRPSRRPRSSPPSPTRSTTPTPLGTIHRDVKPANIMLDESLRPILLDFGLALTEAEPSGPSAIVVGHAGLHVARAGPGRGAPDRRPDRHLQPGRGPLPDALRPPAVPLRATSASCSARSARTSPSPPGRSSGRSPASWSGSA